MKRTLLWALALLFCFALCFAAAAESLEWADAAKTPDATPFGYPRFAETKDGTLLLYTGSGPVYLSKDKAASWTRTKARFDANAAKTVTTASGTTHELTFGNVQPYVLPDGTVLVGYRALTKGWTEGEFYSSIRVMTSSDGGKTYGNEKIVIEAVCDGAWQGFWEPFFIQTGDDEVTMYFTDDLTVNLKDGSQTQVKNADHQRIAYLTYTISTDTWSTEAMDVLNRPDRNTRDGMPTVTKLSDGSYAMVVEVNDYARHIRGSAYNSLFTVALCRSLDGHTWSEPIVIAAPENLNNEKRCAAPSIAALPDGRVIVTYMGDEDYTGFGAYTGSGSDLRDAYGDYLRQNYAMISKAPLTYDSVITESEGGPSAQFEAIELFSRPENSYQIWNTVSVFGKDVYVAGSYGETTADPAVRQNQATRIRRAVYLTGNIAGDANGDGILSLADALRMVRYFVSDTTPIDFGAADLNSDGSIDFENDILPMLRLLLDAAA